MEVALRREWEMYCHWIRTSVQADLVSFTELSSIYARNFDPLPSG